MVCFQYLVKMLNFQNQTTILLSVRLAKKRLILKSRPFCFALLNSIFLFSCFIIAFQAAIRDSPSFNACLSNSYVLLFVSVTSLVVLIYVQF